MRSAATTTQRGAIRDVKTKLVLWALIVALIALGVWHFGVDTARLEVWIQHHTVLGALVYFLVVVASVVLLPFSSLPLLPLAVRAYGVVPTALLSAAGWWVGCLIAFQIARLGRRQLERFTSLAAVDNIEAKVPEDIGFGGIVLLRMILPVDIVSFAHGLLKRLRFRTYAGASLVGIVPFAFGWSYAGGELDAGRYLTSALLVVGITTAVVVVRRFWNRKR